MYGNTLMKPRRFLTSFKIGIMMIFFRISAAVRPSRTVRPRIDWKVLALYLSLIGVTAFFVGMYVVGTLHTGLHQFYPRQVYCMTISLRMRGVLYDINRSQIYSFQSEGHPNRI